MSVQLVVGAGSVGSAVATQLAEAGEEVVVVTRSGSGPELAGVRKVAADASSIDSLLRAAPDAVAIYNCANPEYHRWPQDWPPMASAFLAYAERTGAVLSTCSNLYGYGPVDGPVSSALPLLATGIKGRVRTKMWLDAKALHDAGRIRATEVRGSDYIAPSDDTRLGSERVMKPLLAGKSISVIGPIEFAHSWTAPADVAALMIVAARTPSAWGRAWHVPSNPPRSQRELANDLAHAAGLPNPKVSQVPLPLVWMLGRFKPAIRELAETSHQWDRPFVMDDSESRTAFGLQPRPWLEILEEVVAYYGGSQNHAKRR